MFTHQPTKRFITLGQFIIERQSDFQYAKGELSRLLRDIGIASKIVNREVNKATAPVLLTDDLGGENYTARCVFYSPFCRWLFLLCQATARTFLHWLIFLYYLPLFIWLYLALFG